MHVKYLMITIAAATVTACGGGGDSGSLSSLVSQPTTPTPAPTPTPTPTPSQVPQSAAEGIWIGTTNTNRTVNGVVLNDGSYYLFYSPAGQPGQIGGVIQGSGTAKGGSYASGDGRDFNLAANTLTALSLSSSYQEQKTLAGMVTYVAAGGPTETLTTVYSSMYEAKPALSALAGQYSVQIGVLGTVGTATLAVGSDGSLVGSSASISTSTSNSCGISGTLAPRDRGNAYDATIVFDANCAYPTQTTKGAAYFDASSKRLYVVTVNNERTRAAAIVGTRP